jgi:hypothetical protein
MIANVSGLQGASRKSCRPTSSARIVNIGRLRLEYRTWPVVK